MQFYLLLVYGWLLLDLLHTFSDGTHRHNTHTVRGKILEGENFGESVLMKQVARKILANFLAGLQLFHYIFNVEKFGELYTIHQIRQNFPPPNFSHVRYPVNIHVTLVSFTTQAIY